LTIGRPLSIDRPPAFVQVAPGSRSEPFERSLQGCAAEVSLAANIRSNSFAAFCEAENPRRFVA